MKIPESFLEELRAFEAEWEQDGDDLDMESPASWSLVEHRRSDQVAFPPLGFVAFPELLGGDHGNGDLDGFYWPIGREDQGPLVARTAPPSAGSGPTPPR